MARLVRSLLFIPGNNERFLTKARTLDADIICFDLEDSVPDREKEKARTMVSEILKEEFRGEVYVRINAFETGLAETDINAIMQKGIEGIVIPKVHDPSEVTRASDLISRLEREREIKGIEIIPSIESARGVVNAYSIAKASLRVSALVFGVFDFLHDMGLEYEEDGISYSYARAKVPVDARAAGVYAIDAIWQKIEDTEGLIKDCRTGMKLGYKGKSVIHPNQLAHVHKIFVPDKSDIEWAKKVVEVLSEAMKEGKGAVKLEGKMIDAVHYKRAKALLDAIE